MNLLLLGAGASIPFYPSLTTDNITKYIKDNKNWERIISEYNEMAKTPLNIDFIKKLLNDIVNVNSNYNFEDICGYVDTISSALLHSKYDEINRIKKELIVLNQCNIIDYKTIFYKNIEHIPFLFRCLIVEYINIQHKVKEYELLLTRQKEFINNYIKGTNKSSIITLNYDDIINESVDKIFYNGFHNREIGNDIPFDINKFYNNKHTISYLHGSIRFIHPLLDIHYSRNEIQNTKERIRGLILGNQNYYFQDQTPFKEENLSYNTFITTGIDKNFSLDYIPYNFYYTKFASDICKSKHLVIIGYSFRDQHVNRIISPFIHLNKKNLVIIVDYYKEEIHFNQTKSYSHIFMDIYNTFYSKGYSVEDNEDVKHINSFGYGFLAPQILYYKRGYENFLNEYKEIINYCNHRYIL